MDLILYVHGKGGSSAESEHYKPLFPQYDVKGLDYQHSPLGKREERYIRLSEISKTNMKTSF